MLFAAPNACRIVEGGEGVVCCQILIFVICHQISGIAVPSALSATASQHASAGILALAVMHCTSGLNIELQRAQRRFTDEHLR